jgi:hypothetical protein
MGVIAVLIARAQISSQLSGSGLSFAANAVLPIAIIVYIAFGVLSLVETVLWYNSRGG